jgi:hypothetical protein
VGVGEECLGFRDEPRCADAAVEVEPSLDLRAPFIGASFGQQPLADLQAEVTLIVHLPVLCERVRCAREITFEQRGRSGSASP